MEGLSAACLVRALVQLEHDSRACLTEMIIHFEITMGLEWSHPGSFPGAPEFPGNVAQGREPTASTESSKIEQRRLGGRMQA